MSELPATAAKPKSGYWYHTTTYTCVACGREQRYRERVYDEPKPEDWNQRNEDHPELCYGCLL